MNKINRTKEKTANDNLTAIINNIDSREGIASIASQLLNGLMDKEREIFLRNPNECIFSL